VRKSYYVASKGDGLMKRYTIKFKYKDTISNYKWRTQSCSLYADNEYQAKQKCIELYGLGVDCEYEFINIEELG